MNEKMIHRCVDGLGNKRMKEDISDWVKCGFQFCPWCGMVLNPLMMYKGFDNIEAFTRMMTLEYIAMQHKYPDAFFNIDLKKEKTEFTIPFPHELKKAKKKMKSETEGYAEICERCEGRKNGDPDCISCDVPRMISCPPIGN